MSKIPVHLQESIKWKFTTHLWCTYTTPKKSVLSRKVSVNYHVSNVCCFLFKKNFFLKYLNIFFRVIWNHSLRKTLEFDPNEWGWIVGEKTMTPRGMTIAEASNSCRKIIKCGCKTNCTRQCKCKKYQLRCTELCRCTGNCNNWISF